MTEPHVKLPQSAEELLRDFPLREPDFEAQARAIEARLGEARAPGALSDDALFEAPDLGDAAPPPSARVLPKGHLAEMARRSLQQPKDDAAALARELLAAAKDRKHDAALVERVRAAGKTAPTATPLPLSEPRDERRSGVVHRAEAPQPSGGASASDKRGLVIALAGIAVAAAAAFALFTGAKTTSAPPVAEAAKEAAPAPLAAARDTKPASALPAPAATSESAALSPEALPAAPVADASVASSKGALKSTQRPATAAAASSAPVQVVQLAEDPPPAAVAVAEPKKPESEEPLRPAEGHADNVPLSPSSGAVSTALGSVRSGAQACLAGQTDSVTATITFASDGHVLRVSAGGPSGACIQAALSKARISPFAKDSFSATTTIRPP